MITLKRTNSEDRDFVNLVGHLDADLKIRDGKDHDFYHQFNAITNIKQCIVAYQNDTAVGCGGIKGLGGDKTMEVKRMYVLPEYRGKSIAAKILSELETWTKELGFYKCILETGYNQPEAIRLYEKSRYHVIDNYGQYANVPNSICFGKNLNN